MCRQECVRIRPGLTGIHIPSAGANLSVLLGVRNNSQKQQDGARNFITGKKYENSLLLPRRADDTKGQNQREPKCNKIALWQRKLLSLKYNIFFFSEKARDSNDTVSRICFQVFSVNQRPRTRTVLDTVSLSSTTLYFPGVPYTCGVSAVPPFILPSLFAFNWPVCATVP